MKCHNCKYYSESRYENECKLFGFYCFPPTYEKECSFVDDNCELTKCGIEIKNIL